MGLGRFAPYHLRSEPGPGVKPAVGTLGADQPNSDRKGVAMVNGVAVLGITGFLFDDGAIWFSIPAIVGTLFLLLQVVLGEIGGDLDADLDSGTEFRALSLQSVAAFLMGGGWIAFAVMRAMDQSFMVSALAGLGAGFLMAWAVAWAIAQMVKMQTSGSVSIETAEGETGDVHVSIPPVGEGSGRVAVVLGGKRREYNATQAGAEVIPSHTSVRVTRVDTASNTLVVERA